MAMVIVLPADPAYGEAMGIFDIAALGYLLIWIASLILLFRFKSSGRPLFTILIAVGLVLQLGSSESSVPSGNLYETFVWFGGALDGAMLAILYLTHIKKRFQKNEE